MFLQWLVGLTNPWVYGRGKRVDQRYHYDSGIHLMWSKLLLQHGPVVHSGTTKSAGLFGQLTGFFGHTSDFVQIFADNTFVKTAGRHIYIFTAQEPLVHGDWGETNHSCHWYFRNTMGKWFDEIVRWYDGATHRQEPHPSCKCVGSPREVGTRTGWGWGSHCARRGRYWLTNAQPNQLPTVASWAIKHFTVDNSIAVLLNNGNCNKHSCSKLAWNVSTVESQINVEYIDHCSSAAMKCTNRPRLNCTSYADETYQMSRIGGFVTAC